MNKYLTREYDGIFRQLGFSNAQTIGLRRARTIHRHTPAMQLLATAGGSLGYPLTAAGASVLNRCNLELGVQCQGVRSSDAS